MEILLLAAVAPAAVLLWYVYKKDKVEPEPPKLVGKLFVFGMIAGPIAAILETIITESFESMLPAGPLLLFCDFFIGVALVEEGLKYLFLNTVRKRPEFNYVFDGVVYAVAVALGFAALENILYVFDGGLEVAFTRALTAVPGHCADGVIMGCFFGLARHAELSGNQSKARKNYALALLLPVIEHGFYDAALSSGDDLLGVIGLLVEIAFIVLAMKLVGRMSEADRAFPTSTPAAPVYPNVANGAGQQQAQYPYPPVQQPYAQQPYVQQQPPAQQPYAQQPYTQQPYSQQPPTGYGYASQSAEPYAAPTQDARLGEGYLPDQSQ